MKKTIILAAVACVALASCVKNEVVVDNAGRDVAIGFSPISQRTATKANVFGEQNATYTAGTSPNYEAFKAYAAYTENATTLPAADFFPTEGVECVYNTADYWAPATAYYWPKAGFLTFRAFSPSTWTGATGYAGTVANTWNTGIAITSFTAGTDKTKQVDILYSDVEAFKQRSMYDPETGVPYDDKTGDDNTQWIHNGVNLTFRHAMSAVQFRVVTDQDYKPAAATAKHEFTVKKIEVLNANNAGAFYENRDGSAVAKLNDFADVPSSVTTAFITKNKDNANTATPYWVPTEATEVNYTVFEGSQVVNALTDVDATTGDFGLYGDFILPMPQRLNHGTGNNEVQVRVTYDYKFTLNGTDHTYTNVTTTTTLNNREAKKYDNVDQTAGGTTPGYDVTNWLINHKYLYTLVFKLDPIIFDPKVEAWVEVSDINVDLPYQN